MKELNVTDQRIIEFMDYCVDNEIAGINNRSEFLKTISFSPYNLPSVLSGDRGFSKDHIQKVGEVYGASMDFIFGFNNEMFRGKQKRTSLQMLDEAVRVVKLELRTGKMSNKKSNKLIKK